MFTAWKVSKYGVFSGPYYPAFGLEKPPYFDTFHAVVMMACKQTWCVWNQMCTAKWKLSIIKSMTEQRKR